MSKPFLPASLRKWFSRTKSSTYRRQQQPARRSIRPLIERLEDRLTPADIAIDTFAQANVVNPLEILTVAPPTSSLTTTATDVAANILGLQREVRLEKTTGAQDDSASVNVAAGRASLNLGVNVGGNVLFVWDGTPGGDAVGTVTTNGLGGFDLATETNRFELRLRGDPTAANGAGTPMKITVWTDDANNGVFVAHSQTRNLTVFNTFVTLAYDYSSFTGANFFKVGAITLETVDPALGADIDFDLLLARQVADLELTKTQVTPASTPAVGDLVTYRLTVTNKGPNVADNVTVSDPAVAGLAYDSDNGSGAFNSTTRVWTVGHLDASGPGATKTLDITYRVSGTASISNYAQITNSSAFDPDSTPGDTSGGGGGNPGHQDDDDTRTFTPLQVDFGDAPDAAGGAGTGNPYATLLEHNGARHVVNANGARLGSGAPTTEADGQPNATATGDTDNGVTIPTAGFGRGATTPITVNVTNANADGVPGAFLNIWFDFNQNGIWEASERLTGTDIPVVNGNNTINVVVPAGATLGTTYARFRITNAAGSGLPTGLEPSGEVEDWQVTIVEPVDLSLTKTVSPNNTPELGALVDFTLTVSNAAGLSNATGVVVRDALPTGLTFVSSSDPANFNSTTGDWNVGTVNSGASRTLTIQARVTGSGSIVNFAQVFTTTSPADIDSIPGNGPHTTPEDDESAVTLTVPFVDFGDAPDSYGTTLTGNGARHNLVPSVAGATPRLGATVDAETNGPTTGTGVEDGADEDGVSFALAGNTLIINQNNTITVTGTAGAKVDAWIDFDGNGTFDAGELITAVGGSTIGAGGTLTLTVNSGVVTPKNTFARFRVSTAGGLSATGLAADGEVEDYAVRLARQADLSLTKTLNTSGPFNLGDIVSFTLTVTNDPLSPSSATGVTVTDALPAGLQFVAGSASGTGTYNGTTWTIPGSIAAGASVSITFNARIIQAGLVTNFAQIATANEFDPDSTPNNGPHGTPEDDEDAEQLTVQASDFGDAPDTYGTLLSSGGAQHVATGVFLGTARDTENTGAPATAGNAADGDDTAGATPDDEDGFTAPNTAFAAGGYFIQGVSDSQNQITLTSSGPGFVNAWIDFDGNGVFDAAEQVLTNQAISGTQTFNINVPTTAALGNTYARFRITDASVATPSPTGRENSGEVEDYQVNIRQVADLDLDKAVDNATPALGSQVVYTITVTNSGPNTATGVTVKDVLPTGVSYVSDDGGVAYNSTTGVWTVGTVNVGTPVVLHITARVDASGSIDNYAQITASNQFDIDSTPNDNSTNQDDDDTATITVAAVDFGDAPDSYGTTLGSAVTGGGARHVATGVFLGTARDTENTGAPATTGNAADGDDTAGATPDDEDGFTAPNTAFAAGGYFIQGVSDSQNQITLTSSGPGFVNAWIDFDGNGVFDAAEQVLTNQAISGTQTFNINVPTTAALGNTYARFRITDASVATPSPTGLAASGEVEDYRVNIRQVADLELDKTVDKANPLVGDPVVFTITVTNKGPNSATGVTVFDQLPAGLTFVSSSDPTNYNTSTGIWTVGSIASGGSAVLTITAVVDSESVLTNDARVETADQFDIDSTPGNNPGQDDRDTATVTPTKADFGDAPDAPGTPATGNPYPTLSEHNGARHGAVGLTLGTTRDTELNGQPSANADGDDNNGTTPDDEDGVTLIGSTTIGTTQTIVVNVGNVTGSNVGFLNGWIDFNRDGDWADAGEQILLNRSVNAGFNVFVISIPLDASAGGTFARFRLASASVATPVTTGSLPDGEVEDYQITLVRSMDFGDAPDTYGTLLASNGAAHVAIGSGPTLGAAPDAEANGQPSVNADGDGADEDGVTIPTLIQGTSATITINAPLGGRLDAFIDFNGDGDFTDPNERITAAGGTLLNPGSNSLIVNVPVGPVTGTPYARFRISSAGNLGPTGFAADGEVEDYRVTIVQRFDFGDAPDSYGTTVGASGAQHVIGSGALFLGAGVDAETDGQPATASNPANGDDTNGSPDDEDGVTFVTVLGKGGNAQLQIVASKPGQLDGFIDYNQDGIFQESERINGGGNGSINLAAGTNLVTIAIPGSATVGNTYARFRLSSAGGLGATGQALDGEVEDYQVSIVNAGSVSGTVYVDVDKDGVLDAGEPRLGGVVVTLIDSTGQPVADTVTAPDGTYKFTGVLAGTYSIVETQPNAYGSTTPNTLTTTVVANVESKNNNFGEIGSTLAGKVFYDPNNNGLPDAGEPGIIGVTVKLTGTDVNGQAVSQTTATNLDGSYQFTGLAAGTYTVTETQPANYTDGIDSRGKVNNVLNGTVTNDQVSGIVLGAAQDGVEYNFAERGLVISGTVFLDLNANGTIEAGDTGIPQVTLSLRNAQGNIVAFAQTAPDGSYLFNLTALGLPAGKYSVVEIQPQAYGSSLPADNTRVITVPATGLTNVNFGDTLGSIGGFVYLDVNKTAALTNNGVKDAGEVGIEGVTITLTGKTITGQDVLLTTVTDANGAYKFDGLSASDANGYKIAETQPAAFADGKDTRGTINAVGVGVVAPDAFNTVKLGGGQNGINYNFGELSLVTGKTFVAGTVFIDANNDGKLTPGEVGMPGVTVTLLNAQNSVVGTQTTDANGNYLFTGIAPATYTIVETQPAGFDSTSPTTNKLTAVVPLSGLGNQNFGETQGSLQGFVYQDTNDNGTKDPGEQGIAGVLITLSGQASGTTTTAADGSYSFTGLTSGAYTITESQPANFGDGKDTAGSLGGNATTVNDAISVTAVQFAAGKNGINYNFGERPTGLNGRVFLDLDNDGLVDPGEVGIAGVVINLTGVGNPLKLSTVTDANGFYRFPELPAGNFTISEVQPAGFVDGRDRKDAGTDSPTNDQFVSVATVPGQLLGSFNFGEQLQPNTGFVKGTVFLDRDRNQTQGGTEPGQPAVLVELLQGNTVIATTPTNPDGSYNIFNLVPGTYTTRLVNDVPPTGFGASTGTTSSTLTVPPGGSATANFGLTLGSVSGFVYRDLNLDGVKNVGEAGIASVIVNLTGTDVNGAAVTRSLLTDENGFYRFQDLVAGNYTVAEPQNQPALINFYDGDALAAGKTGVVDVDLSGNLSAGDTPVGTRGLNQLSNLSLGAGQAIIEDNFGEVPPADPSGFVFIDRNNDGFKDPGEAGIANVSIRLTGIAFAGTVLEHTLTAADFFPGVDPNLDGDNDPLTVRTDANGQWAYEVLPPGTFTVVETQPVNFFDGIDRDDTGALATVNDRHDMTLAGGQLRTPFNFGERLASLSGHVFVDNNNNGVQDANDPNRAGVIITLTGRDSQGNFITRFTTTNALGNYTFGDLPPSDATGYQLTMTTPAQFLRGQAFPGRLGAVVVGRAIQVGTKHLAIDQIVIPQGSQDLDGVTFNFSLLLAGKNRFIGR